MRGGASAALLLLSADAALAHSPIPGVTGFPGGLLHPLLVPAHLMALAALGLVLGRQTSQQRYAMLVLFAASLVAGIGAIASALAAENPEVIVLGAAAILGALVALGRPVPLLGALPIVFALGAALMLDSVPQEISTRRTLLTLLGTTMTALTVPTVLSALVSLLRQAWHHIGMRIVGSWIAASAVLVLALRLAK